MSRRKSKVAERRKYSVMTVSEAKQISKDWLISIRLEKAIAFGLPEVDDRYHIWRIPLIGVAQKDRVGEIVIDARTSLILKNKTTAPELLEQRLLGRSNKSKTRKKEAGQNNITPTLRNTIAWGDSDEILDDLPAKSVDLVFTSPPYFNARPEYTDYISYEDYLLKLRKVIHKVRRVLSEGGFFVINISPVLIRRASRNESSKRLAVPFDIHKIFIDEEYDFIDDIIWVKPEGAGWATGRGRRFSADRNPQQYKPVPVTEYILVYKKRTDKLIDWNIRRHSTEAIKRSKIGDPYEITNVWRITPAHDKHHPAIFPLELAEKVIRYYSFVDDVVLDPFAGIGTVGKAAIKVDRRFVLIENQKEYVDITIKELSRWLGEKRKDLMLINCAPDNVSNLLF